MAELGSSSLGAMAGVREEGGFQPSGFNMPRELETPPDPEDALLVRSLVAQGIEGELTPSAEAFRNG